MDDPIKYMIDELAKRFEDGTFDIDKIPPKDATALLKSLVELKNKESNTAFSPEVAKQITEIWRKDD